MQHSSLLYSYFIFYQNMIFFYLHFYQKIYSWQFLYDNIQIILHIQYVWDVAVKTSKYKPLCNTTNRDKNITISLLSMSSEKINAGRKNENIGLVVEDWRIIETRSFLVYNVVVSSNHTYRSLLEGREGWRKCHSTLTWRLQSVDGRTDNNILHKMVFDGKQQGSTSEITRNILSHKTHYN